MPFGAMLWHSDFEFAGGALVAGHLFRNQVEVGSTPITGSSRVKRPSW